MVVSMLKRLVATDVEGCHAPALIGGVARHHVLHRALVDVLKLGDGIAQAMANVQGRRVFQTKSSARDRALLVSSHDAGLPPDEGAYQLPTAAALISRIAACVSGLGALPISTFWHAS